MLRKLLIVLCVFLTGEAAAQAPAKPVATVINYKETSAPLPGLRAVAYYDTSKKDTAQQGHKKNPQSIAVRPRYITATTLKSKGNLFVMMFNPNCDHCDEMTTLFEEHAGMFKKSKLLLLADAQMTFYLSDYTQRHHIEDHSFIYLGSDSSGFINNTFLYQGLPQINIYDADLKLLKTFAGEAPFDSLLRYIK